MVPAVPGVVEIVGTIVIDGVTYLLQKFFDEAGKLIWRAFFDEDGDNLPDDPENPFMTWDEEPDEWFPFDPSGSFDDLTSQISDTVVFMTPDGPVVLYTLNNLQDSTLYDTVSSMVTEKWVEVNGAMVKPYHDYTVSEAYLFIIAVGTIVSLFSKIFKRRKM